MTLAHATCVAIDGIGILIRGPSGSGKSDLALRLIDGGAVLVADDYCNLIAEEHGLEVRTPDTIAGKIEMRGHGIIDVEYSSSARVGLVVDLAHKDSITRLPETQTCTIEGVTINHVVVDPDTASAASKIRLIVQAVATGKTARQTKPMDLQ